MIYSLFQVDNGSIKLSGCSIEPKPVLKLKLKSHSEASEIIYFTNDGEINHDFANSLRLDEFEEIADEPTWLKAPSKRAELDQLLELAQTKLAEDFQRVFQATVFWCKHVDGKLTIEIGEQSGFIKFSYWAQRIVDGLDSCPPYLCEYSGKSSYQIVSDDLGNITVPQALKTCEITQKKIVESQIAACSVSGRQVAITELWTCPASGKKLLETFAKKCSKCDQSVSPEAIERGFCIVCRSLNSADPGNPTIGRILENFPVTQSGVGWKESACQSYAVVTCRRRLMRLLFVIDLTDDSITIVRKSNLLGLRWKDIDVEQLK